MFFLTFLLASLPLNSGVLTSPTSFFFEQFRAGSRKIFQGGYVEIFASLSRKIKNFPLKFFEIFKIWAVFPPKNFFLAVGAEISKNLHDFFPENFPSGSQLLEEILKKFLFFGRRFLLIFAPEQLYPD